MFQPADIHPNRPGIIAPVRVDALGLTGPTRRQARGRAWRRSSWGFFVPSWTSAECVEQRIVEAAAHLPAYGGVTGWAALRWHGGFWFTGNDGRGRGLDVPIATGGLHARGRPGIAVSEERLDPREVGVLDGLRVTTAVRATCFAMRYAGSQREAARVLDLAAYSDLVSIEELRTYAYDHPAWTGIPQCREAIPYADENSWSPAESDMRWVWWVEGGFPRPLANRPVFDLRGRHLGTPDLIDPVHGVVGQYDGDLHLARRQRVEDIRKEAVLRSVGLEHVTMVAPDRHDHSAFLRRLREAYGRAASVPAGDRAWTVVPPVGWVSTTSVVARRRLDAHQRDRLLGYRRAA